MGEMPSSMSVPRLEASSTLPEWRGPSMSEACGHTAVAHGRTRCGPEGAPHPVEGVGALVRLAAIDGDLAADQEDEQRNRRPQDLFLRIVSAGGREWTVCTEA